MNISTVPLRSVALDCESTSPAAPRQALESSLQPGTLPNRLTPITLSAATCLPLVTIGANGDADSISAWAANVPTYESVIYDCRLIPFTKTIDQFLVLWGSLYKGLGPSSWGGHSGRNSYFAFGRMVHTVIGRNRTKIERIYAFQAANVVAVLVGVGPALMMAVDATVRAEVVLRGLRVELIELE